MKNHVKQFGKDLGKSALTTGINELNTTAKSVVSSATAPLDANKSFIHIKDFYNFIKTSSENAPTPFFYFSPNFYAFQNAINLKNGLLTKDFGDRFFKSHMDDFNRFRMCIQAISFPVLSLQSYNEGVGGGSGGHLDLTNIYGGHTILKNSYLNAESHTLSIQILNTQRPLLENFIYQWLVETLRTDIELESNPIPRVNMAVKFWSASRLVKNMEGIVPDFVYYVTRSISN